MANEIAQYGLAMAQTAANASITASESKAARDWQAEQIRLQNQQNDINYWRDFDVNRANWKMQNEYNEGLWNKQNSYNELMWQKANDYNSPLAQMNRFKEAGLNPNLIYGQSNMGGSIQTANLEPNEMPASKSNPVGRADWKPNIPQFDFINGLLGMAQLKESSARTNNLEAQNAVIAQEAILRAAQVRDTTAAAAGKEYDTDWKKQIQGISYDALETGLAKTNQEMDLAAKRFGLDKETQTANLEMIKSQLKTEKQKQDLNELELSLKRMGIYPGDSMWARMIALWWMNNGKDNYEEFKKNGPKYYQGPGYPLSDDPNVKIKWKND